MPYYVRAPIQEAIFDVRVVGDTFSALALDDGLRGIHTRYPQRQEIAGAPSFELTFKPDEPPAFNTGPFLNGIRYSSEDGHNILQARLDGFSFNRAGEYQSWEAFEQEARFLWERYVEARKPRLITRLGLRYINHFVLPSQEQALPVPEYFELGPMWNVEQIGVANGFHMQLSIPQPAVEGVLLLTQSMARHPNQLGLVIDIDVFCEPLRWDPSDASVLWDRAAQLRACKNRVFEACLKDPARELIR